MIVLRTFLVLHNRGNGFCATRTAGGPISIWLVSSNSSETLRGLNSSCKRARSLQGAHSDKSGFDLAGRWQGTVANAGPVALRPTSRGLPHQVWPRRKQL